jgi:pyruvate, water dikinase
MISPDGAANGGSATQEDWDADVRAPGEFTVGRVFVPGGNVPNDGVLLVDDLDLKDYGDVVRSQAVVCEVCETTSHIAIVCRILGIPVMMVEDATAELKPGDRIAVDPASRRVIRGISNETAARSTSPAPSASSRLRDGHFRFQLSIVGDRGLIDRVNACARDDVDQFFLREELLWVARWQDPYAFLVEAGVEALAGLLVEALLPLAEALEPAQRLNYRALDIRSDQLKHFGGHQGLEANPHLGLHGIRRLLLTRDYVRAELMAVDRLYDLGFRNVIYSIPFLALETELRSVLELRRETCEHDVDIGLFVETPAAVIELPHLLRHPVAAVYVGTKDLSQLVLAADRDNGAVAHLLDANARPVLECIAGVVEACQAIGIPSFVFTFLENLAFLETTLPGLRGVSLPASDYLRAAKG